MRTRALQTDLSFLAQVRRDNSGLVACIAAAIRDAIERGLLRPGDRLPATRTLARELGIARGTLTDAYDTLVGEGHLEARRGSGTFVTASASFPVPAKPPRLSSSLVRIQGLPEPLLDEVLPSTIVDLRPCRPAADLIAAVPWRRAWMWAASRPQVSDYGPPQGDPVLRASIAAYVRRVRGLRCEATDVVITAGAVEAFHLLARLLLRPGDRVAMEDPGYPMARGAFAAAGARIEPTPVDEDGIEVARLGDARLAYITPSHQFPTGVRLTLSRRRALLAWAEAHDAFVIEDDYDGEFRFDGPPLPPLASLPGAERVAYVGTFSKVLAPSLRLGYVISPQLSHPLAMRKAELNYQVCAVSQLALSRFIDDLHLDRHVARVRRVYAARRAALLDALRDVWRDRPVMGLEAGLHACLPLKHGENAEAIVQACFERQVAVADASVYALRGPYAPALVLGYAAYPTETLRAAARVLASAMRGSSGPV